MEYKDYQHEFKFGGYKYAATNKAIDSVCEIALSYLGDPDGEKIVGIFVEKLFEDKEIRHAYAYMK